MKRVTRRHFLQTSSLAGGTLMFGALRLGGVSQLSPNERLNIGVIGVANQGNYNLSNVAKENIVALCDVDANYLGGASARFPSAKKYSDFRRLIEQRGIDAIVVATPDHTHAVATVAALRSGRHVYCEKPLTRTLSECRAVMTAARESKRATQIGTQIHAGSNYRRVVELIRADAIGAVKEVHVWVNASYGSKAKAVLTGPPPADLHYDLWLGPVPERAYSSDYVPIAWRNWWAFGGGALADFGCHYMDLPHWALDLKVPLSCEVIAGPEPQTEAVPPWLIVRYQYPSAALTQKSGLALTWYHGGKQPGPEVLSQELAREWRSGVLFVGAKGNLLADYNRKLLLPESAFDGFTPPPPSIPESVGHHAEWLEACKSGGPTTCNFQYSGALTESVLIGNVAFRARRKIEWDSENLQAKADPEANTFVHHQYRSGWSL